MRDGICPKCGSEDVYSGANVSMKSSSQGMNAIPIRGSIFLTTTAALDNYVCIKCGYVESYITGDWELEQIAKEWPKVRG